MPSRSRISRPGDPTRSAVGSCPPRHVPLGRFCRPGIRAWRASSVLLTTAWLIGCAAQEPPGAAGERPDGPSVTVVRAGGGADASPPLAVGGGGAGPSDELVGTIRDNLPFEPSGEKLASIAWRTWIYTDTGPKRTRYGYLRAGAVVDRRGPEIVNDGCRGGWYRINPRGFVCIGKGATLVLDHPVVVASSVRPVRGHGFPYVYAMSQGRPPHLYFRLPSEAEMRKVEGEAAAGRAATFRMRAAETKLFEVIGEPEPPPPFLASGPALPVPYGVQRGLHRSVHSGQASADSGFAIQRVIDWEKRLFGLTTELDLIALDRTRVVRPSALRGIELREVEDLPVAFVTRRWAVRYERKETGQLAPAGSFEYREGLKLTGERLREGGVELWETRDGAFVPASSALILRRRKSFPSVATGSRKWIDVSINGQSLVAYEGTRAVYATLVSTGRGGLGDPDEVPATVRGTFMIHAKHVTETMDGDDDVSDSFNLRDVPFVQYFHKGYALHGTYWHDDFGRIRSHGCINLSPVDSAWLFEWTDPRVPPDWHGALNKERGTVVHVRP